MKRTLIGLALVLSLALTAGCNRNGSIEEAISETDAEFTLTASDLSGEFQKNLNIADDKFTGKIVVVTGTVAKVQNDTSQRMVELRTGNPNILIDCYFANTHKEELAKTNIEDEVTIKGKCKGISKYVEVEGCSFVKFE